MLFSDTDKKYLRSTDYSYFLSNNYVVRCNLLRDSTDTRNLYLM